VEVVELEPVKGDHEVGEHVEEHPVSGDRVEEESEVVEHQPIDSQLWIGYYLVKRYSSNHDSICIRYTFFDEER
jgi:ribosomal protein L19